MGRGNTKHGKRHTKVYSVWCNMKTRCNNPNSKKYPVYGGRGIKVSEDWHIFSNFYRDMGDPTTPKHTLDRIDTNGNYCKENCRWVTNKENCRNKRNNVLLNGKTISEWSEILGVNKSTLSMRFYKYNWPVDKILTTK